MPRDHRTAELRSIALHRLVVDRLDDEVLSTALARVDRWIATGGPVAADVAVRWRELLRQPAPVLARRMVEDSEEMRDLRQSTPFAGVLSGPERWRVLAEIP